MKAKTITFFILSVAVVLILFAQKNSLPSILSVHNLFSDDLGVRERIFTNVFERTGGAFGTVDWCRGNSKIIFTYAFPYQDPNEVIPLRAYTVNADGTGLSLFSNDGIGDATWSPDGAQIVFDSDRTGYLDYQVYKMNADGTNPVQLTTGGGTIPTWSPDGTRIAFCHDGIWTMSNGGGGLIQLTSGEDGSPSWSPDGTRIVFSSPRSGTHNIWIMNSDGTGMTQLTTLGGSSPEWSPDGKWIGFIRNNQIGLVTSDGRTEGILRTTAKVYNISWSPDSKKIVFQGIVDLKWDRDLYVITLK